MCTHRRKSVRERMRRTSILRGRNVLRVEIKTAQPTHISGILAMVGQPNV